MSTSHRSRWARAAGGMAAVAAAVTLTGVAPAGAHTVNPHQHRIVNPSGVHDIANGFCNGTFLAENQQNLAIHHFHDAIHTGPQGPENGLVTIVGVACS
jgi:hypothetical protein